MFTLKISTANEAFDQLGPEVARILRELADKVETSTALVSGNLRDINGNTVGSWRVS